MEEYRYNRWSRDKKKGSTLCDRIPVGNFEEVRINNVSEYTKFIPQDLGTQFTSKDFKTAAKINIHTAQTTLNILNHIGAVKRIGKKGNLYVYARA